LALKVDQSKGAVSWTLKPYDLAWWRVSAMAAALKVTFLGTHLDERKRVSDLPSLSSSL